MVFRFLGALAVLAVVVFGFEAVDFAPVEALAPAGFALEPDPRVAVLLLFGAGLLREAAAFVEPDADAAFVLDVERPVDRRFVFLSPIGRASPTAFMAPPATSPTVPAIFPAVLPTFFITLPASGIGRPPCVRRLSERSIGWDACPVPARRSTVGTPIQGTTQSRPTAGGGCTVMRDLDRRRA